MQYVQLFQEARRYQLYPRASFACGWFRVGSRDTAGDASMSGCNTSSSSKKLGVINSTQEPASHVVGSVSDLATQRVTRACQDAIRPALPRSSALSTLPKSQLRMWLVPCRIS
ncbi:unnamed protein product [Symbiodinium natans]|uniref:Uncharacterized protein n=1 Tax=Symbiodinium natans TaxID=878477 RepID=A0A812I5Q6_9DINO|nr:unnamed protein product [Symbiodinium natans]